MLPYATPALHATVDPYEQLERDALRAPARRRLGAPAAAGARIALALCEVEAGMRSPLQLERLCHLSLWPKLAERLQRSGGPAVTARSLVRVIAQEHTPGAGRGHRAGAPRRAGGGGGDAAGRRQEPLGAGRAPVVTRRRPGAGRAAPRPRQATYLARPVGAVHNLAHGGHRRRRGRLSSGA